jgi:release factor glutamine methyltransferase
MISIEKALTVGRNMLQRRNIPAFEADLLLEKILQMSKIDLIRQHAMLLKKKQWNEYVRVLHRRKMGEPLSYILGYRSFYKSKLIVSPYVLIPRQETELLVEASLEYLQNSQHMQQQILEIGTGSGAISIALAKELPLSTIDATDISQDALDLAYNNILNEEVATQITLFCGDLYRALREKKTYSLIVSNPPYIPSSRISQLEKEVQAEPLQALDGGKDGLDIIFRLIQYAPCWLKKHALLLMEIDGEHQINPIKASMQEAGFYSIFNKEDLAGNARIMGGYLQ